MPGRDRAPPGAVARSSAAALLGEQGSGRLRKVRRASLIGRLLLGLSRPDGGREMASLSDHVRRDAEHAARSEIRVQLSRFTRRMDEAAKAHIKSALVSVADRGSGSPGPSPNSPLVDETAQLAASAPRGSSRAEARLIRFVSKQPRENLLLQRPSSLCRPGAESGELFIGKPQTESRHSRMVPLLQDSGTVLVPEWYRISGSE
ncbi:MAG: hypothetical protein KatS3mg015_2505 [Fimbriimonadales bacterium]|nr:MAG: hypothetical protein KatS3mg015_2505 [Fimbriimonadales bacterium]